MTSQRRPSRRFGTYIVVVAAVAWAAVASAQAPGIATVKTVGLDPSTCAATQSLTLPPGGGDVTYCYTITNTGDVTATEFDLLDDQLGTILSGFAYTLAPGESVFVTESAFIAATTTNIASWVATLPPSTVITNADSALVTVQQAAPAIELVKTVGTDPSVCAAANQLDLPVGGGGVYYCYQVTNTGNITFDLHDVVDDQLGAVLSSFAYSLAPGASVFVTAAATITETTVNSATWTASGVGIPQATADGDATVTVRQATEIPTLSGTAMLLLGLLVGTAGLLVLRRLS